MAKINRHADEITGKGARKPNKSQPTTHAYPQRTPIPELLGDVAKEQDIRNALDAQKHFAYEEFADPQAPSGIEAIIHPLATADTNNMSMDTLKLLERDLKLTLNDYGPPKADIDCKSGADILPRLRFRSLVAVSWAPHEATKKPLKLGIYGTMIAERGVPFS
ncbi:hypothetical protein BDV96DRAFT_601247 [Lophiotrema nucula]|uniref:Uncharacterized protein n=1 Tax=Lophiotrema nucula TaxID=690887 RepID=A0A6A5Z2X0_9PLEO|nr:hypothetical protein BDV96DRAFT_601247 [Lophiotrema nucula]